MMIFDGFPSRERATAFSAAAAAPMGLRATAYLTATEAVVQVARPDGAREFELEVLAAGYGGRAAEMA
jgi:hypothetical protein